MPDSAAAASQTLRVIAGLGNPGLRYRDTRHNIGFLVLDQLAAELGLRFAEEKRWKAEVAKTAGGELWLVKPQTFMNLSGEAVGPLARWLRVVPGGVLAVVDDMDLPWGRLRLRPGGSAGGHNGLRSLQQHFGSGEFPRLRVGVGRPEGPKDAVGHVLGKFSAEEKAGLASLLERATVCVLTASRAGLDAAMNRFNPAPAPPPPPAAVRAAVPPPNDIRKDLRSPDHRSDQETSP
jgi:peptidyl-tRNA hydrolase, PTH1 family